MLKNALFLFVVTAVVLALFLPSYARMQDLKQRNLAYAKRIKELEQHNAKLTQERERLIHDPEYLEKVARKKMGLIREGEKVYNLVPQEKKKP